MPLTPYAAMRAVVRRSRALDRDEVEHLALPVPDQAVDGARERGRGLGELRVRLPARRAAREQAPGTRTAAAAPCACGRDERSDPVWRASPRSPEGGGLPLTAAVMRSRSRDDRGLHLTEELARPHELLPAGQHLPAQQRPVGHALLDVREGLGVGVVAGRTQRAGGSLLGCAGLDQLEGAPVERVQSAREGLADHAGPGAGVAGQGREPGLEALDVALGAGGPQRSAPTPGCRRSARSPCPARAASTPGATGSRSWPRAARGRARSPPRCPARRPGAAAPRGRRRHSARPSSRTATGRRPRAAGSPAPGWQRPRSRCPGRRAAPCRAAGSSRRPDARTRAVLAGPARDPAQAGQHPVAGEPVAVLGMVDQDRADRGRAEDARTADLGVDDGVDQSGLAGARRAADDGQQRGVEGGQAGHDVVVELPEQRLAVDLGGLCLGDVEWEAGGGHLGPQCRYRTQQCRALVPLPTHGARLTNPGHTERTAAPVSAKGSSKSSTGTGPTA